jgi:hypothetical protein
MDKVLINKTKRLHIRPKLEYLSKYYEKNRDIIRVKSHLKYIKRKQERQEQMFERKRYFLLCKKVDYIFGLTDSWI